MQLYLPFPHTAEPASLQVQAQVHPQHHLHKQQQHQPRSEAGMCILPKLPALVCVSEEVANNGEDGGGDLGGDMPARLDQTEHHARGKKDAPGQTLNQYVYPYRLVERLGGDGGACFYMRVVSMSGG